MARIVVWPSRGVRTKPQRGVIARSKAIHQTHQSQDVSETGGTRNSREGARKDTEMGINDKC